MLYVVSYTDEDALAVLRFTLDHNVVQRLRKLVRDGERSAHELTVVSINVPEGSTYESLDIDDWNTLENMLGNE